MMIGRQYSHVFPPKPALAASDKPPILEIRNLSWTNRLREISLTARAGEVVGLGGLDGQGQRELLLALFGVLKGVSGELLIDGRPVPISAPRHRRRHQTGDLSAPAPARRRRGGDHLLFNRL